MKQPTATDDAPVPEWWSIDYLVDNGFERLAKRRCALKQLRDRLDKEIDELNPEIGALLATAKLTSVTYGRFRLALGHSYKGGRLIKSRLLELGVTPETIAAATTPKEVGESYITVTDLDARKPDAHKSREED
jgi:hypothetical protein